MTGRLKRNYSLAEVSTLASPVDEKLSVAELPRFVEALGVEQPDDAIVHCTLNIAVDEPKKIRITGTVEAEVLTQCQRCLGGLPLSLSVPIDWHLPEDVQGDDDSLKLHEIELRLLDWVEDDLQLSIPLFAKHDNEDCGGDLTSGYVARDEEHTPDTVTPFDGLKDLLSKQ